MTNNSTALELKLHSPAGTEPAVFTWSKDEQDLKNSTPITDGSEVVRTIRLVFEDYPVLYQQNLGLDNCDIHSYSKMKELCDRFNKIIDTHVKLNRGTEAFSARLQQRPTVKLFRHIFSQIYSRAVTNPDKLRNYEPFSPSVYGETSPDLVDSILKAINLTEDQTFIDLGSGVGNVVLHVAALANCKHVYGIEYEDTPAKYACAMAEQFRFWMRWYGKHYSDFHLEQGDFLTHAHIDDKIREADIIFTNNYAFGSTVNHGLKIKFVNMKDGAKIISSREFCPETFRLNDRTKNDLGAVMHVTKPEEFLGKVSWADRSVQYYLHVIDHSKLAHYYEKMHEIHMKASKTSNVKQRDDDHSSISNNSSSEKEKKKRHIKDKTFDENQQPVKRLKHRKRKIKAKSSMLTPQSSTSSSSPSVLISTRGRKVHLKRLSDNGSGFDSDDTNEELLNFKRRRSSHIDHETTLNELHTASENFVRTGLHKKINNRQFNYPRMTNLPNDNLDLYYFRDCLVDRKDEEAFNSINTHIEQYRERLIKYFIYMKSDVYREHLKLQLDNEIKLNKTLKLKVNSLENNIKTLLEDAIQLLKLRTNELGIEQLERPVQLITYASDISNRHKELRAKIAALENEINAYTYENNKMSCILNNILTNGQHLSGTERLLNDNVYSTLLVSMSKQTQEQASQNNDHFNKTSGKQGQPLCLPISPNNSIPIDASTYADINQNKMSPLTMSKSERKTDFIIQKRSKKAQTSNLDDLAAISTGQTIKTVDKQEPFTLSILIPADISTSNIDKLLSTKKIEPVQVHSVIVNSDPQAKQVTQTTETTASLGNVQTPISTHVASSSNDKSDDNSQETTMSSPRKKRDFYGKSTDPVPSDNSRPSSTPACTEVLPVTTLPDRPVSIPPLRISSYLE